VLSAAEHLRQHAEDRDVWPIAGSTQVVAFRLGYESLKNFKKELEV